MCVNYRPPSRQQLVDVFDVRMTSDAQWPAEAWKDYAAPIILLGVDGKREAPVANYAIWPRRHMPKDVKPWDTMNARDDTIGKLRSYASAWKAGQLCLVPAVSFFEPNYESGSPVRWEIGMADDAPFAVAGLWRSWKEQDGSTSLAFSQITINADEHTLMRRFHKPDDEKRSLVVVPRDEYDDWLACRDPEVARSFLRPYPAELMKAWAHPMPPRKSKSKTSSPAAPSLFSGDE